MNKEQLEIYKRAAQKSNHVVRVNAERLLAIIALAEQSLADAAPKAQARYEWLANRVLACDYGDNDTPGQIGWRIRHDLLAVNGARQPAFMYGESIDAAVDAAILQSQKGGSHG